MSQYAKLDEAILAAIRADHIVWADSETRMEAERIAVVTGRDDFRVIDARMTALKKSGRIEFDRSVGAAARLSRWRVKGNACTEIQVLPAGAKEEFEAVEKS